MLPDATSLLTRHISAGGRRRLRRLRPPPPSGGLRRPPPAAAAAPGPTLRPGPKRTFSYSAA